MIHDADYQMSQSCGQDDPLNMLKNSFFSCLIGIYFSPFFFEHTVDFYKEKSFRTLVIILIYMFPNINYNFIFLSSNSNIFHTDKFLA